MAITFDPTNRVIMLDTFNVSASTIWSRWVDWLVLSDNAKYLPAFSQVGGVAPIALYLILENGWRVRPQELDGITTITGNLLTADSSSPITQTLGVFNVQVNLETPVAAQAIEVNTGSGVTPQDKLDIATQVWAEAVRTLTQSAGLTPVQEAKIDTLQSDVTYIKDIEGGKWEIVGNEMVFYKADNTTEVSRFTLAPTADAPTSRTRV